MPLAQDMFGDGFRKKLSALAATSEELNEMLEVAVFSKFRKKVERHGGTFTSVNFMEYVHMPRFFWREACAYMCHSQGWPMIGAKAVNELVDWMKRKGKSGSCWVPVKKTMPTLMHDGTLYMFRSDAFDTVDTAAGKYPSVAKVLQMCERWRRRMERSEE